MHPDSSPNLVESAHRAGRAEVASEVLHNVGNVLNTLNISISQLLELHERSPVTTVCEVLHLMDQQGESLPQFLVDDARGRKIQQHLPLFEQLLSQERAQVQTELQTLQKQCLHLREIIASQQVHSQRAILLEVVALPTLAETAIDLAKESLQTHKIQLQRCISTQEIGSIAKTKLLQVMVNLIRNACEATANLPEQSREIKLHLHSEPVRGQSMMRKVFFSVDDNGHGIAADDLTRIFAYGFTTKTNGHGFGLHSCANAMAEMGGSISAFSPGLGQGATFTITFPMKLSQEPPEPTRVVGQMPGSTHSALPDSPVASLS
ncbi:MAG: sensor histidine kinase [Planctomycetaceae bacterium]